MKKVMTIILCLIQLFACLPATAAETSFSVLLRVNGVKQNYETACVLSGGRTYAAAEELAKAVGGESVIDADSVCIKKGDTTVIMHVGSCSYQVNGEEKTSDAAPIISDDIFCVPLRAVTEALGCYVEWDAVRREALVWTVSEQVVRSLKNYDELFDRDMVDWYIRLYDPEEGGFYAFPSEVTPYYYGPKLEATAQTIDFLIGTRLIGKENGVIDQSSIPDSVREKLIHFFQSRQSDEDGYFYDPQQGTNVIDSRRERNFTKSVDALKYLGAKPLYKTPEERIKEEKQQEAAGVKVESVLPKQYQSEENFIEWLHGLSWENDAYLAGNSLSSSVKMITAAGYKKIMQDFVTEQQNSETGLWGGDERNYATVNAAMKLSTIYDKDYPYPNLQNALESLVYVAETYEPDTASSLWNLLMLLNTAKNTYADAGAEVQKLIDDNFVKLNAIIMEKLAHFKRPDGGYAYSSSGIDGKEADESGVNGNLLCTSYMREQAYWVYKLIMPPLLDGERDYFFTSLAEKEPVAKSEKTNYLCQYDFENMNDGMLPAGFSVSAGTTDGMAYIQTVADGDNTVMEMTGDNSGYLSLQVPIGNQPDYEKLTISQNIKIADNVGDNGIWYQTFGYQGGKALEVVIDSEKSGDVRLRTRKNGAYEESDEKDYQEIGTISRGEWHKLTIDYIPRGTEDTEVRFYIDDSLALETHMYYNGGNAEKMPGTLIDALLMGKYNYTAGTIYLDNIEVMYE